MPINKYSSVCMLPLVLVLLMFINQNVAAQSDEKSYQETVNQLASATGKEQLGADWLKSNCPTILSNEKARSMNAQKSGASYMPPLNLKFCREYSGDH